MRTKTINNAKLVITVNSNKSNKEIETVSVFDNRKNREWTKEEVEERGIKTFLNLQDLKETLNWNLNGDSSKFQFKWRQSTIQLSEGRAYVFN